MTYWELLSKSIATCLFIFFCIYLHHNVLISWEEITFHHSKMYFLPFSGVSLTCYSCYSTVNWTHCDEQQQKYFCEPWLDVCAKSKASFDYMGLKFDVYERGCFKGDYCNTMACKFISQAEDCDMQCCDYDFCNDAALPTYSKILVGCLVLFAAMFKYVLCR